MRKNSARGRGWRVALISLTLVGLTAALGWWLARAWVWREVRAEAERRGVELSGCELDFGFGSIGLAGCEFGLLPHAAQQGWPLPGVQANGAIERVEVELSGWQPERIRARGVRAVLRGEPPWLDGSAASAGPALPSLPVDLESGSVSWYFSQGATPTLELDELAYAADSRSGSSQIEIVGRARGSLAFGPDAAELSLSDISRPGSRLHARLARESESVVLGLDLTRLPLRMLEAEQLRLTPTLRAIEIDGRVSLTLPIGLTTALPAGNLRLTLHGLQFPVPREVEGLVYGTPPQLSGRFEASRRLDRVSFPELTFLTGSLEMHGRAQLDREAGGIGFRSHLNGPLACRAIAESAARAHRGSVLAALAGQLLGNVLAGSVQVSAALEGHSSELERARVVTSIGVGCGLRPLPDQLR